MHCFVRTFHVPGRSKCMCPYASVHPVVHAFVFVSITSLHHDAASKQQMGVSRGRAVRFSSYDTFRIRMIRSTPIGTSSTLLYNS